MKELIGLSLIFASLIIGPVGFPTKDSKPLILAEGVIGDSKLDKEVMDYFSEQYRLKKSFAEGVHPDDSKDLREAKPDYLGRTVIDSTDSEDTRVLKRRIHYLEEQLKKEKFGEVIQPTPLVDSLSAKVKKLEARVTALEEKVGQDL